MFVKTDRELNITQLPPETLMQVFTFCPVQQIGELALVCQKWRDVAYDDTFWKGICSRFGWQKTGENMPWRTVAEQSPFFGGKCLRIKPVHTYGETSVGEALSKWSTSIVSPPLYREIDSSHAIYDLRNQSFIYLEGSDSMVKCRISGERCATLNTDGVIQLWDLETSTCIYQYESKAPDQIQNQNLQKFQYSLALDRNLLVSCQMRNGQFGHTTQINTCNINRPESDYMFSVPGWVLCSTLEKSSLTLLVHNYQEGSMLYLINLKDKTYVKRSDESQLIRDDGDFYEMEWRDKTLWVLKMHTGFVKMALLESWDFTDENPNTERNKQPKPLTLIEPK